MITERLMRLGEWSLTFTDPSLYDDVDYFDHVVIVPGRLDHAGAFDDAGILAAASYAGVIRSKLRTASSRSETDDRLILSGAGLAFWLGDEDGKGHVIEVARDYSAATFADRKSVV